MPKKEVDFWKPFLGKSISLSKDTGKRPFYYNGVVLAVFDDKLVIDDVMQGETPISFAGLSYLGPTKHQIKNE